MFVRCIVGTTVDRNTVDVMPNTTVREILEQQGVDYARGVIHIDGASLAAGGLNKTLVELGYDGTPGKDRCYILNVVKADNAA